MQSKCMQVEVSSMTCLKLEDRRHEKDTFKIRRLDHMAKSQERAAKEQRSCANNVEKTCKQGTWEMEMLTGHEFSAVIQGERTRVWCRRCVGDADTSIGKSCHTMDVEGCQNKKKNMKKRRHTHFANWKKCKKPPNKTVSRNEGSKVTIKIINYKEYERPFESLDNQFCLA